VVKIVWILVGPYHFGECIFPCCCFGVYIDLDVFSMDRESEHYITVNCQIQKKVEDLCRLFYNLVCNNLLTLKVSEVSKI
jgi:hypothetical protein